MRNLIKNSKKFLTVFNHQIMIEFFKEIQELPTRFLFPMLKMEDFKDSFDKNRYLNLREESIVKSAPSKHNNSLMRIGEILDLPTHDRTYSPTYLGVSPSK